jgi:thiol-disulfide isomerase/thioredoxin
MTDSPQPVVESTRDKITRLGLVAVVLIAILGSAYIVSEKAGLDLVGSGGVNAQLLPKVGDTAPELIVIGTDQQIYPLSAFRGTPVWINFWGSWCQPCRAEMPEVIRAYDTLRKQGVLMLGVNEKEEPSQALNYANTVGINFPIVFPTDVSEEQLKQLKASGEVPELVESTEKWQVNNYPTHVFIDSDGIVQAVVIAGLTYESALHYGEMILPNVPIFLPATPGASPTSSPEATPAA